MQSLILPSPILTNFGPVNLSGVKKILALVGLLLIFGQCKRPETYYFEGNALGTTYHIRVQGKGQSLSQKDIQDLIRRLNASLSTYQATSLISCINRGDTLPADKHFRFVLERARKIYKATGGRYDPTIGILVNAWGFGPGRRIPGIERDSSVVDSLMHYVGLDMVKIDSAGIVRKKYPQIFIDFNSIAKGYVIDRIAAMIAAKGYRNYLVELGGEVVAHGRNIAENRDWIVGIDYPTPGSNSEILELYLRNRAIATSGNYRKFKIDPETGRKYVHTIDARTGYPAISHLLSASVLAPDCTDADGWATACMASGFENAKQYIQSHPELDAVLIYSDTTGKIQVWESKGVRPLKVNP